VSQAIKKLERRGEEQTFGAINHQCPSDH